MGSDLVFFKKRKKRLVDKWWLEQDSLQTRGVRFFIPNDPKSRIAFTLLDFCDYNGVKK